MLQKEKLRKEEHINGMTSFFIIEESYTFTEPLLYNIRNDERVKFAGYIKEHPLEDIVEIRIKTDSYDTNIKVFEENLANLIQTLQDYKETLNKQI